MKIETIQTLDELFTSLTHSYPGGCESIAPLIPIVEKYCGDDWRQFISFNSLKYNRIPLNHLKNRDIEFVLIAWSKGQMAPLHNHPQNGCIVKILSGNISEFQYDMHRELKEIRHCREGDITYMDDTLGLHEVVATDNSISLHIYSPPNYTPQFFR